MNHDLHYMMEENGEIKTTTDLIEWAKWFEKNKKTRIVKQDQIGDSFVSTVFLATDYNFEETGDPILFETMVFGGPFDHEQERYTTSKLAKEGHEKWCQLIIKENEEINN